MEKNKYVAGVDVLMDRVFADMVELLTAPKRPKTDEPDEFAQFERDESDK
jgi:hypothetical protein